MVTAEQAGSIPNSWSDALHALHELEDAGEIVTQVIVPFDGAPEQ